MKNSILSPLFIACFLMLGLCFNPVFSTSVMAAEKSQYKKKQTKALRAKVYEKLAKAQEKQEAGDYAQALKILDALKQRKGRSALKPHELAQLYNFYAYVYLAQDKYPQAIRSFEKVLQQPDLFIGMAASTKYALAQLYFATDNVDKAVKTLESWFNIAEKPSPDAYVLLAQGYLQQGKLDKALPKLKKAFSLAKQKGKQPKENWYTLLQYIYAEKKDYKNQVNALEVLVNRWPKKAYWLSLVGVYGELDQDKKRLYVLETAYIQGMLDKESYLVALAQMLSAYDMPYKAAKVMEKGFSDELIEESAKNLERTGDYWRRAKEIKKALPRLAQAAQLSKEGEPGIRLAYLYMNNYQYKNAAATAKKALKKGGIKRPYEARFLLGQALFHAQKYTLARKAFNQVISNTANKEAQLRLHKLANQWLNYMETEIQRQKEIKIYLKA
ncbi:MAG: tetratricopeptide repeat protein [Pseudomonadales bacterium]|nr:tetratricopeptide repeat protein [Pseudomonadales bacterium]